ncbi:hypothetical protein LEP1GSC038_3124, partial [Leptospira weilii str. 2006001855]
FRKFFLIFNRRTHVIYMKFENPNSFLQNQIELFLMVFEFGLRIYERV